MGPALLAAALFLAPLGLRAQDPAASPDPTPAPSPARPLRAWRGPDASEGARIAALEERLKSLDLGLEDLRGRSVSLETDLREQQSGVSSLAGAVDAAEATLDAHTRAQARLARREEALAGRVGALEGRQSALDESLAGVGVRLSREQARRRGLARDLAALSEEVQSLRAGLARQSDRVSATQASLKRLDALDQLLGLVQKDVQANDEELVGVQRELARLERPDQEGPAWWRALVGYKYLPVLATGLSVLALGLEASRR